LINGIVQRFERGDVIVNIGQGEGIVPFREQVPRESYRRGDRIRAYILEILHDTRGPQIILSRTHPNFLIQLFKTEVPEISEGIVSIMGAVRDPGIRAKIAVSSNDSDIDPVGACVGMRGSRVQNVVQELKGEKIDMKVLGPKLHALAEKGELVQLVLQADKEVKHGLIVRIMDLAKSAGVSSIIIAAQWDPKKAF